MNDFQSALDHVHATLHELREQGVDLRASAAALERLAETPTALGPASETPAARPPVQEQPMIGQPAPNDTARETIAAPTVAEIAAQVVPAVRQSDGKNAERLAALRGPVLACTLCPHLVKSRTQVVFGVGNPDAELMFVGEAPGEDEDRQGEPFVGKAGQLLTKIIQAMGYTREDVYIGNVLKCRPDMPPGEPGNRKPKLAEMQTCLPYLRQQIEIIQPRALVALGATAMEGLTGTTEAMSRLRGRWHDFQGIPLMATYHPAYLLRNQSMTEKRKVWEDMLLVLEKLGNPISEKQRGFFLSKG